MALIDRTFVKITAVEGVSQREIISMKADDAGTPD